MDWIELPPPPGRRRNGITGADLLARRRRWIETAITGGVVVFALFWIVAIVHAVSTGTAPPGIGRVASNPLAADAPPPAPRLLEAAMERLVTRSPLRGRSGQVNVVVQEPGDSAVVPDSIASGVTVEYAAVGEDSAVVPGASPPPGVWNVLLRAGNAVRRVPDLTVLSMVPLSEKRSGRIGQYMIGTWPNESGGTPRSPEYAAPRGLVRVTPENLDLPVSRHFKLRHFVTKGQENVWPKYVLLSPRLLDKLELTIDELSASGTPVNRIGVISGFRTPSYNAGGGNTAGRGALSRHMYGDAMDWFVDNDGDGRMDDLNGDGRIDTGDGRVIVEAAERVEKRFPDLIGGIGLYKPTGAHSGFVHIDTRGSRARW